jgi:hypothetical protein
MSIITEAYLTKLAGDGAPGMLAGLGQWWNGLKPDHQNAIIGGGLGAITGGLGTMAAGGNPLWGTLGGAGVGALGGYGYNQHLKPVFGDFGNKAWDAVWGNGENTSENETQRQMPESGQKNPYVRDYVGELQSNSNPLASASPNQLRRQQSNADSLADFDAFRNSVTNPTPRTQADPAIEEVNADMQAHQNAGFGPHLRKWTGGDMFDAIINRLPESQHRRAW